MKWREIRDWTTLFIINILVFVVFLALGIISVVLLGHLMEN